MEIRVESILVAVVVVAVVVEDVIFVSLSTDKLRFASSTAEDVVVAAVLAELETSVVSSLSS